MASLDDVLSDKPTEKPAAEAPAEPKAEPLAEPTPPAAADGQPTTHNVRREHQKREWAAQGRDPETGQFLKKDAPPPEKKAEAPKEPAKPAEPAAKPAAPPQEEMTAKERAAFAAAADERRKRQALEQEIAQLRQQPAKPAEAAKTFWDDPDGAFKTEEQKRNAAMVQTRLQTAEMIARSRYADFDEKIATFKTLVEQNPGLIGQWISSPDPASYAYNLAKNHQDLQQVGGMEAMRKKIEEETAARVRKEVEAEQAAKAVEMEKQRAALPPSLSDVRGGTSGKTPAWGGPTPLGTILGKSN